MIDYDKLDDNCLASFINRIYDYRDNQSLYPETFVEYIIGYIRLVVILLKINGKCLVDLRYSGYSAAATISTTGGPVGDQVKITMTMSSSTDNVVGITETGEQQGDVSSEGAMQNLKQGMR